MGESADEEDSSSVSNIPPMFGMVRVCSLLSMHYGC